MINTLLSFLSKVFIADNHWIVWLLIIAVLLWRKKKGSKSR